MKDNRDKNEKQQNTIEDLERRVKVLEIDLETAEDDHEEAKACVASTCSYLCDCIINAIGPNV